MTGLIAALALAVLAAGFFAAAELALLSTSRIRLRRWVRNAMAGEGWLRRPDVIDRPHQLLSPILIGRGFAVTTAALLAARITAERVAWGPPAMALGTALALAVAIFAIDTAAGALARSRAERLFPIVSVILRACAALFRPLVAAADVLTRTIARGLGGSAGTGRGAHRRILETLLQESERTGVLEPAEREIIAGVFEFGRMPVRQVMRPLEAMVVAPAGARAREISRLVQETGYSRIPLHGRRDRRRIVGMVHVFDLLKTDPGERPHPRPVVFTGPETPCDELLVRMKRRRSHLAIVVEGNRALGLVTMEDLVEMLVGEIRDEHDARAEGRHPRR